MAKFKSWKFVCGNGGVCVVGGRNKWTRIGGFLCCGIRWGIGSECIFLSVGAVVAYV